MKRTYIAIPLLIFLSLAFIYIVKSPSNNNASPDEGLPDIKGPLRIVSLSPSITETLFALGAGDRVVGVTRFCSYPAEAREKEKVGGYVDPNYETIAMLKPDLVILLPEHDKAREYLDNLGLEHMTVHNRNIRQIKETVESIGRRCGLEKQAGNLLESINLKLEKIKNATRELPRQRVLFSLDRPLGNGTVSSIYVAGKNTLYDELIELAGAENACGQSDVSYPLISAEGLLHLAPDVIIELAPMISSMGLSEETVIKDWQVLPGLSAVANNRIHVFSENYCCVPGPRFVLLLEDMVRVIHPGIQWN